MAIVLAFALASPIAAAAEDPQRPPVKRGGEPGRAGSFEIYLGGELLTPQTLGSATATMTTNNSSGTAFNYFSVAGTRATAPALRGRIGYNITRMFTVEGGIVAGRGDIRGSVSADAENVPAVTVTERLTQYFIDASLLVHLAQKGAVVPFLEGGGGYLRQLHAGNIATNTGQIYHVGGGVTYMFSRRPGRLTGLGIRVDGRVYIPRKSYSFNNTQQIFAGVGGGLLLTF
jgi:hypothetical protein